jgi:hypothetical protein
LRNYRENPVMSMCVHQTEMNALFRL